jgi:hypothetical protein
MSAASDIIDGFKATAATAIASANDKAATISAVADSEDITPVQGYAGPVGSLIGTPTIPNPPAATDYSVSLNDAMTAAMRGIEDIKSGWISKYFPAAMPNGMDNLLAQIIGGAIVTATQQEIMWARARNQAVRDAARATDEAVNRWASRGFAMPGGVVNNQLQMVAQDLLHVSADLAGQQAIKALDMQIDAVKFAAETGVKLQLGLIDGIARTIAVYASIPVSAAQYASAMAEANARSQSVILEYYKTMLQEATINLTAQTTNASNFYKQMEITANYIGNKIGHQIQAYTAEAGIYASNAAAAMGGLNAVAAENSITTQ